MYCFIDNSTLSQTSEAIKFKRGISSPIAVENFANEINHIGADGPAFNRIMIRHSSLYISNQITNMENLFKEQLDSSFFHTINPGCSATAESMNSCYENSGIGGTACIGANIKYASRAYYNCQYLDYPCWVNPERDSWYSYIFSYCPNLKGNMHFTSNEYPTYGYLHAGFLMERFLFLHTQGPTRANTPLWWNVEDMHRPDFVHKHILLNNTSTYYNQMPDFYTSGIRNSIIGLSQTETAGEGYTNHTVPASGSIVLYNNQEYIYNHAFTLQNYPITFYLLNI